MKVIAIIAVLALSATVVAAYPGCRSTSDCQKNGDKAAYCRENGYCHCDQPFFNATNSGTCELVCCPTCAVKCCTTDKQCQASGDSDAYCRTVPSGGNGWCHCGTTYGGQFCDQRVIYEAPETVLSGGKAVITDCGTSATHAHFSSLSITPNPPVKGSKATLAATGTVNEAVSAAKYTMSVSLDGNQLYVHSGDGCGQSTFSLPLGFGSITINGAACPLAAGSMDVGFDLTLPTAAPPGNYAVQFTATDQSSASLWCIDTKFTF